MEGAAKQPVFCLFAQQGGGGVKPIIRQQPRNGKVIMLMYIEDRPVALYSMFNPLFAANFYIRSEFQYLIPCPLCFKNQRLRQSSLHCVFTREIKRFRFLYTTTKSAGATTRHDANVASQQQSSPANINRHANPCLSLFVRKPDLVQECPSCRCIWRNCVCICVGFHSCSLLPSVC